MKSYAAHSPIDRLGLFEFDRRSPRADDVVIQILCCGVCHSDIEVIRIQDIDAAYERMLKADVKYRFVIDMSSLRDDVATWRRCATRWRGEPLRRPGWHGHIP